MSKITADDFIISKSEGKFGPIWVLTDKNSPNKHYVLRSDFKMSEFYPDMKNVSPGVHLDKVYGQDPLKGHHDWKGIYRVSSMQNALTALLEDLNRNKQLEYIGEEVTGAIYDLKKRLDDFEESLDPFPKSSMEEKMKDIQDAYAALVLRYDTATTESMEEE